MLGVVRVEVVGERHEPGRMSREMQERDLLRARRRDARGRVERDRVFEPHLAACRHLREKERGEDLGDGADLENRVAIDRPLLAARGVPVGDHASTRLVHKRDDVAHAAPRHLNALAQDFAHGLVRREGLGSARYRHKQRNGEGPNPLSERYQRLGLDLLQRQLHLRPNV